MTPRARKHARFAALLPAIVLLQSLQSFVLLVVIIVATSVLYLALDAMGVFDSVNKTLAELFTSNGGGEPFKITAAWVIGLSAVLGAINVVLFTALMTLGAFVYNVCADLVGGVEVTLAERE